MNNKPLVSILMPAYNHESFVDVAISSVFTQTYRNLELIIIDDGSKDKTAKVIKESIKGAPIQVKFVSRGNKGVSATLNEAFRLSTGDYIAILASDDAYHERFIEVNIGKLTTHFSLDVASHCESIMINEVGEELGLRNQKMNKEPINGNGFEQFAFGVGAMVPSTLVTSRSVMEQLNGYDESLVAEDFDFHLRMARLVEFIYIPEPLFFSRVLEESLGRKPWLWANDIFTALDKHQDVLQERLPPLKVKRASNIAVACFLHGGYEQGIMWLIKATSFEERAMNKVFTFFRIIFKCLVSLLKRFVKAVLPRTLVQFIKRR